MLGSIVQMEKTACKVDEVAYEKVKTFNTQILQDKKAFIALVNKNMHLQINALTLESTRAKSHRNHVRFY